MKWYKWNVLGDFGGDGHSDFFFTDNAPEQVGSYCLSTGLRLSSKSAESHGEIRLKLGEDYPGLVAPSYIGNTDRILICNRQLTDCILSQKVGEIEVVPFVLINHRDRVQSRDYVFVNPIGTYDAANTTESVIKRYKDGRFMKMRTLVLDLDKTKLAPDLFRLQEEPGTYICSENLAKAIREHKFTNVGLDEIEVK